MPHKDPEARKAYEKKYRAEHREQSRANAKRFRLNHPGYDAAKEKRRKEKNPEHFKALRAAASKRWRKRHPERHAVRQMRYYWRHRDRCHARMKKWAEKNIDKVLSDARTRSVEWARNNPEAVKAKRHRRRARKLGAEGSWKADEWKFLKSLWNDCCLCCGKKEEELIGLNRKLVPDHVLPLTKGGSNDLLNIQPLCHGRGGCNNKKFTKHIDYRGGIALGC